MCVMLSIKVLPKQHVNIKLALKLFCKLDYSQKFVLWRHDHKRCHVTLEITFMRLICWNIAYSSKLSSAVVLFLYKMGFWKHSRSLLGVLEGPQPPIARVPLHLWKTISQIDDSEQEIELSKRLTKYGRTSDDLDFEVQSTFWSPRLR